MMKGKAVYLRPIRKEDMTSFYECVRDEETRYMTGTKRTFTMEDLYKHYEHITKDETRHDFAICLIDGDKIIGDLSIVDIDADNRKGFFRIALHNRLYFNKGYGTEAVRLALEFSFEKLKLNRLQLEVFSHNVRGMKSYEKAGFKKEGVLRQSLLYNNQFSDEIIMGMLKEEYDKLKAGGRTK
ncbi:GNAT family N-acetyltransferase [Paenibacillus sp. P96]|uniref:GNAT family N-acetyltransferase n=1 Tax=Paenibacillus zeirhizosphaerae TaxID=2987519 RepID=A0ABT9FTR7_9BACL|nr:GNAT family protein [Paenibacillus sp. P96]MDP4098151.1 GNAT family N-acetyltransferase [Paenibacillus sp. P96]